jgi:hypothetical protein
MCGYCAQFKRIICGIFRLCSNERDRNVKITLGGMRPDFSRFNTNQITDRSLNFLIVMYDYSIEEKHLTSHNSYKIIHWLLSVSLIHLRKYISESILLIKI